MQPPSPRHLVSRLTEGPPTRSLQWTSESLSPPCFLHHKRPTGPAPKRRRAGFPQTLCHICLADLTPPQRLGVCHHVLCNQWGLGGPESPLPASPKEAATTGLRPLPGIPSPKGLPRPHPGIPSSSLSRALNHRQHQGDPREGEGWGKAPRGRLFQAAWAPAPG